MSLSSVTYKTQRVLGDMGEVFSSKIAGDGRTTQFELPWTTVDSVTASLVSANGGDVIDLVPAAYENGLPIPVANDFSVDNHNGLIVMTVPPGVGQVLTVQGVGYETFGPEDLQDYVEEAFLLHTQRRNPPVFLDPAPGATPPTNVLPQVEERPLALLAASLVYGDLATAAARDITIDTGDGTVVPRAQAYQQLVAEQARVQESYVEMVNLLGVQGYATIQVMNLRRVSLQTNRLVPEYVEREWDDREFPQRVLPPIDIPLGVQGYEITDRGLYSPTATYNPNDTVFEGGQEYLQVGPGPCIGVDPAADCAGGTGWAGDYWEYTTINSGMYGYSGWAG